jgi:LPS-assembly protein
MRKIFMLSVLSGVLSCAGLLCSPVRAQEGAPALKLKPSAGLVERWTPQVRSLLPTFVQSDFLTGQTDLDTRMQGNSILRKADTLIRADSIDYYQPDDRARATGNVYLNRGGNRYQGSLLDLQVDAFSGFFLNPNYQFLRSEGHGSAQRFDFIDDKHSVAKKASYTTCTRKPGPSWLPDWILEAEKIKFDNDLNEGTAQDGVLRFMNVPLLPIPSFSFPLTAQRKSGFLPPVFAIDNKGGIEASVPYYVNLAPNRDLTVTTTSMAKRGTRFDSELRYLERKIPNPPFEGVARLNVMPYDALREKYRWGYSHQHAGWPDASQPIGFGFNLNRVSDSNYWKDFSTVSGGPLTQRLLPSSASLAWARGTFSTSTSVTQYQTLQDVTSPIAPPFNRLPQVNANYVRGDVAGFDMSVGAEATRFSADRLFFCSLSGNATTSACTQPNAQRLVLLTQVSAPQYLSYGYITPKLMLQTRKYQYDETYKGIDGKSTATENASVTVPTFSIDSGVVFERPSQWFGTPWTQTLEPRAYFVNTPYRSQSDLPNYDTGANDFNFATIYTENAFSGQDRISDSRTLTAGVTSRLIDAETGAEGARFVLAQRFRFKDQKVGLTPTAAPLTDSFSDILVGASTYLTPRWTLDSIVQYNPETSVSERTSVGMRYTPSSYRVLTASYRYQRSISTTMDVAWQWPLNDLWGDKGVDTGRGRGLGEQRWFTVGRGNYSMLEKRFIETLTGLEYDAGCWVGRVAISRSQVSLTESPNSRLMFQLEFTDFSRVGINPLATLKNNIPRYQNLRENLRDSPSRFGQYE